MFNRPIAGPNVCAHTCKRNQSLYNWAKMSHMQSRTRDRLMIIAGKYVHVQDQQLYVDTWPE